VLDEDENTKSVYIFRKGGNLLISVNGNVTKATWELLDFENILLENDSNSYLYNHGFLDNEVLILKKDNSTDFFTLVSNFLYQNGIVDLIKLKDHLTNKYIKEKTYTVESKEVLERHYESEILTFEEHLKNGSKIFIEKKNIYEHLDIGLKVFDDKKNILLDGLYILITDRIIEVVENKIFSISFLVKYNIQGVGELLIEQQNINCAYIGDKVSLDGNLNINGEFKLSWGERIYVKNGIITKRKIFWL
jgi:hypothetical protein